MSSHLERLVIAFIASLSMAAHAGQALWPAPQNPDPGAKYLFYMHGRDYAGNAAAEGYYREVVDALARAGFVVIAEIRPKGTIDRRGWPGDYERYAHRILGEVNRLLDAGVPAGNVFISGFSRGGVLTLMASALSDRADLGYVVMAGCMSADGAYASAAATVHERYSTRLKGRLLSLRDVGDADFGSCADYVRRADTPVDFREVVFSTGLGHRAFLGPRNEWVEAIAGWAGAGGR